VLLHASLIRPRLLLGGERTAVLYNYGGGFALFMLTRSVPGLIAAVVLCAIVQAILVALAKRDPQSLQVNYRSMKYQAFYANAASIVAKPGDAHAARQAPIDYLVFAFQSTFKGKKGKQKNAERA
jgi:type IV secretory pathway TrbD component